MTQPTGTHETSEFLASAGLYGLGAAFVSAGLGLFPLFLGLCVFSICSSTLGAAVWIGEEIQEAIAGRKRGSGPTVTSSNKTTPSDDRKPGALANVTSPTADFTGAASAHMPEGKAAAPTPTSSAAAPAVP